MKRSSFCKDLDKIKTANISNINFRQWLAKQVCSYLTKLITFTCTDLSPKKAYEAIKEKKDVISNWSHPYLRRHNFDFHSCNTVVAVDLFVVAVVAAAAATVVVPVVGKHVQQ